MKLTLTKETLDELTADDMAAIVGGGESDSCTLAACMAADRALRALVGVSMCQ